VAEFSAQRLPRQSVVGILFSALATPAGKPQFHVDADRSARVAQMTPDLLAYGAALRLWEQNV
jgi:hypothetical protein